jgi:hypothetical protein
MQPGVHRLLLGCCVDRSAQAKGLNVNTNASQGSDETVAIANLFDLRHISAEQLAQFGIQQIAYVKPVVVDGSACFAVHAADGTPLAIAGGLDVAIAAIVQHEMVPVQLH